MVIRVYGTPGPQGSKKFVGLNKAGRGILVESSKKVKTWREAVKWAVLEQFPNGREMITGAIAVTMVFTMKRPKSAKKGAKPSTRPDVSKLVRATEDALTDIGVWEDDARIVEEHSFKVFPGEHLMALSSPGVIIHVTKAV